MRYKITMRDGTIWACNAEFEGVFELVRGAYHQHRGTGQTPIFKTADQFRRYVNRLRRNN